MRISNNFDYFVFLRTCHDYFLFAKYSFHSTTIIVIYNLCIKKTFYYILLFEYTLLKKKSPSSASSFWSFTTHTSLSSKPNKEGLVDFLWKGTHTQLKHTDMRLFYYFKPNYPHAKQLGRHTPRNLRDYWSWSLSTYSIPKDVINRRSLLMGLRLNLPKEKWTFFFIISL